ncbi:MAG TPA: ATP-binding cassette domain-containing protein [Pseudonocardiaceae bacterium]|nr:ATP-binding cassette domain-containing protein [Pseudonocardiaceae bacterium]
MIASLVYGYLAIAPLAWLLALPLGWGPARLYEPLMHSIWAIVGRSGAGKSTVVALLLRFFDPDAGRVRLGGFDIRDVTVDSLRAQVAVVSQNTYLDGTWGGGSGSRS